MTPKSSMIDAASYYYVSRDPAGTIIAPARRIRGPRLHEHVRDHSRLTYACGFTVTPESALTRR